MLYFNKNITPPPKKKLFVIINLLKNVIFQQSLQLRCEPFFYQKIKQNSVTWPSRQQKYYTVSSILCTLGFAYKNFDVLIW